MFVYEMPSNNPQPCSRYTHGINWKYLSRIHKIFRPFWPLTFRSLSVVLLTFISNHKAFNVNCIFVNFFVVARMGDININK